MIPRCMMRSLVPPMHPKHQALPASVLWEGEALSQIWWNAIQGNLVSQGVTPRKQAYPKTQLVKAVQATLGVQPYLNCATGSNAQVLQEVVPSLRYS